MTYRFGPFHLDDRALELFRDGRLMPLRPQPCRLLAHLVAHAGELVTKDEIIAAVWKPGARVRFDGSVGSCLKQIRAVLGDDANHPTWIATSPRRGYRFLQAVTVEDCPLERRKRRLLVLPVSDTAGDDGSRPLAGLLGDEIEIQLARMAQPGLMIVASVGLPDALKGRPSSHALREAHVDFTLDCRLQQTCSALRVSAQLIDIAEQTVRWADIYDVAVQGSYTNIAALRAIAYRLAASVSTTPVVKSTRRRQTADRRGPGQPPRLLPALHSI